MGTIRVGQKSQKTYQSTGFTTVTAAKANAAQKVLSEDEKKKLIESIMQMPTEKRVAALRNAGLSKEADEYEAYLAEEHIRELNEDSRKNRLAEIKELSEEEQLPLLIEEGFDEEAKELSEKLALAVGDKNADEGEGEGEKKAEDGDGGENTVKEENADGDSAELSGGDSTDNAEKAAKANATQKKTSKKTK